MHLDHKTLIQAIMNENRKQWERLTQKTTNLEKQNKALQKMIDTGIDLDDNTQALLTQQLEMKFLEKDD
jgi:predicted nucleic acid-binding protein